MSEIAHDIATFVREHFQIADTDTHFTYDAHLWEQGFIDSVGVVELIAFLEDNFQVEVPPSALFDENCTNINGLARLIAKLVATNPSLETRAVTESRVSNEI